MTPYHLCSVSSPLLSSVALPFAELQRHQRGGKSGFTLIEMLVVLALVGFIAFLGLPYLGSSTSSVGLVSDCRVLASRLRAARELALIRRSPTKVTIDLTRLRILGPISLDPYYFKSVERGRFSVLLTIPPEEFAPITFFPDGGGQQVEL